MIGWRKKQVATSDSDKQAAIVARQKAEKQLAALESARPVREAQSARVRFRAMQNGFGHELELVVRSGGAH